MTAPGAFSVAAAALNELARATRERIPVNEQEAADLLLSVRELLNDTAATKLGPMVRGLFQAALTGWAEQIRRQFRLSEPERTAANLELLALILSGEAAITQTLTTRREGTP